MAKRAVLSLAVAASLCLSVWGTAATAAEEAKKPDATIELKEGSVAAGIGFTWGAGVLQYQGKAHPFKIDGLSLGDVGITQSTAKGEVYNLKKLEDVNGTYVAAEAGATAAGGGSLAVMKNQNGVTIHIKSTSQGAKVTLGEGGMKISLTK